MDDSTKYNVLIRTDNYKTTVSKVNKDKSIYKPNKPNHDNRKDKGLKGLSKKDKAKGKNTAIAMAKYYGKDNLNILTLTYHHCDKRLIKAISSNFSELIKILIRKLNSCKIDYIVSIGIQDKTFYKYNFPVYDTNIIVSNDFDLKRFYKDVLRLWNNSKYIKDIGFIELLNDVYMESLISYKHNYLTWLDYYIPQIDPYLIDLCILHGYQDWLLSKWLYCKLNDETSKYMIKIESTIEAKEDWKQRIYDSTYKNKESIEVLPYHKVKKGLVIGHLKPLEDNPDSIHNILLNDLNT